MSKPKSSSDDTRISVGLVSLGCAKNLVDAEIMLGSLMKAGVEITPDTAAADVVIINTCSFIDAAQEESVDTILESAAAREARNRGQALVVSGCLAQRFRDELPRLFPEVDAFMGIDQVGQVADIVVRARQRRGEQAGQGQGIKGARGRKERVAKAKKTITAHHADHTADHGEPSPMGPSAAGQTRVVLSRPAGLEPLLEVTRRPVFVPDFATPRFRLTPKHFAYVKIAEGCNHPCSFCTIPRMRGSHRSRRQDDIVREACELIAQGVRELNLISQDSTYYGLDLRPARTGSIAAPEKFTAAARSLPADATTLCTLLRALNALDGDFWIRLLYTHPAHWTDELIQTIAECPKVARYVDMPLQHIHDAMLERMRRETSRDYIVDLIRRIRAGIPGIALRTTFIVGFPGETERHFETLLEFIRETRFERLGVFTYSKEEGTRAGSMAAQVGDALRRRRRERAMAEQLKIARELSAASRGRELKVLVERKAEDSDLQRASVSSWEHGLVRDASESSPELSGRHWIARGEADAPDIDGRIYARGRLRAGEFARVRIVGSTDYDLIAEALS